MVEEEDSESVIAMCVCVRQALHKGKCLQKCAYTHTQTHAHTHPHMQEYFAPSLQLRHASCIFRLDVDRQFDI